MVFNDTLNTAERDRTNHRIRNYMLSETRAPEWVRTNHNIKNHSDTYKNTREGEHKRG